jgi:hypothetical protein
MSFPVLFHGVRTHGRSRPARGTEVRTGAGVERPRRLPDMGIAVQPVHGWHCICERCSAARAPAPAAPPPKLRRRRGAERLS